MEKRLLRFVRKFSLLSSEDCWNWSAAKNKQGYGVFKGYPEISVLAHRISYTLFVGPVSASLRVCHRCDNPSCVNPRHLFLGTARDNTQDAIKKNRINIGRSDDKHYRAKLTNEQVLFIRKSSLSLRKLAKQLNVNWQTIHRARRGYTFKDVR